MDISHIYTRIEEKKRMRMSTLAFAGVMAIFLVSLIASTGSSFGGQVTRDIAMGPQNHRANRFSTKYSMPRTGQFSRTAARVAETSGEPWQRIADKLIDIDATNEERIAAVRNLLERRADVQKDLTDAAQAIVRDRNVESAKDILYPTGTEARKQIDGFEVVLRQLQEDIVPELNKYTRSQGDATLASLRSTISNPRELAKSLQTSPNQVNATELVNELRAEFAELQRHPEEIQKRLMSYVEESKNVFRRTPVGLEMPRYKVASKAREYEVREYEPYSIITTPTRKQAVSPEDPAVTTTANAKAFNTLASYLFGKNEDSKVMAMTAPVEMIADEQGSKSMAFILPTEASESTPSPVTRIKDSRVRCDTSDSMPQCTFPFSKTLFRFSRK